MNTIATLNPIHPALRWILGGFLISLLLTSCGGIPDHARVIPDNSIAVISIDLEEIAEKGGLEEIKEMEFYQKIIENLKREDKDFAELVEEMVDDPFITGIDVTEKAYFSVFLEGENPFFLTTMGVRNRDKFREFLTKLLDKIPGGDEDAILDDGDYDYLELGRDGILAWGDDALVLLSTPSYRASDGLKDKLDEIMALDEGEQVAELENFEEFHDEGGDIAFWINTTPMARMFKGMADSRAFGRMDFDEDILKDNYAHVFLNFEEGSIKTNGKIFGNEQLSDFIDEIGGDFEEDILEYIPGEDLRVMYSLALNFDKVEDLLEEFKIADFDKYLDLAARELNIDADDIFDSPGGSFLMAIGPDVEVDIREVDYDYSSDYSDPIVRTYKEEQPLIVGAISMNNHNLYNGIKDAMLRSNDFDEGSEYITFKPSYGPEFYFGDIDDIVFITNHKKTIRKIMNGGYSGGDQIDSEIADLITDNDVAGYAKLDEDAFESQMLRALGRREARMIAGMMGPFTRMFKDVIYSAKGGEFEMEIRMENDSKNSLMVMMDKLNSQLARF